MEAVVTLNENSPGVKYLCAKDKVQFTRDYTG